MSVRPKINKGDVIKIGSGVKAVVCAVYDDAVEVVHDKNKPVNEYVVWSNNSWMFESDGPCGGYVRNNSNYQEYINILKNL